MKISHLLSLKSKNKPGYLQNNIILLKIQKILKRLLILGHFNILLIKETFPIKHKKVLNNNTNRII